MADDTPAPNRPTEPRELLKSGDVFEFFKDVAGDIVCSVCKTNEWILEDDPNYILSPVKPDNTPGTAKHVARWLFVLTCRKCGHVLPFSARRYYGWKQSRDEKANSNHQ